MIAMPPSTSNTITNAANLSQEIHRLSALQSTFSTTEYLRTMWATPCPNTAHFRLAHSPTAHTASAAPAHSPHIPNTLHSPHSPRPQPPHPAPRSMPVRRVAALPRSRSVAAVSAALALHEAGEP